MKCSRCERRWPHVNVETYYSASESIALCDDCLFVDLVDDMPIGETSIPRVYVAPNGSEHEWPSYAS